MERLDGPLAELVAAEREEIEAMPRSKDAAWAGIAAGWQPPPPPVPPAGVPEAAAAAGKGGALKIVAALVVGTSVAAGAYAVGREEAPPPVARVEAPTVETPALGGEPALRPETLPVVAEPPARPDAPPEADVPEPPPKRPETAPALGLAEELALIDAMRKDVAAGRYAEALQRAKEHRASFSRGRLVADRMDLEAAARCGRGDERGGRALAERKAKRWPRAPMSKRLRTLCKLEDEG